MKREDGKISEKFPDGWHYKTTKWNPNWTAGKKFYYNQVKDKQLERENKKKAGAKKEPTKAEKKADLLKQLAALE